MEDRPQERRPAVPAATHPAAVQLPVEGSLPSLAGATGWLNSPPLTRAGLRGSVVLVDFWTYTCINWLRTLPYLRAWADKYRDHGLVVLGVHTPEFDFEHDLGQRPPRRQGPGGRLPGRGRQRLRHLDRLRQPLLAGAVLRRRPRADPPPSVRRGRVRAVRDDRAATADRGRRRGHRARTWWRSTPVGWRRPPTGTAWVAGELPRLRADRELRLTRWCGLGYAARLCRSRDGCGSTSGPLPVTGRSSGRPSCSTRPTGGSSTVSTPATCTWSWDRPRRGLPSGSGCCLDGQPPGRRHGTDVDDEGDGTVTHHGCTS